MQAILETTHSFGQSLGLEGLKGNFVYFLVMKESGLNYYTLCDWNKVPLTVFGWARGWPVVREIYALISLLMGGKWLTLH